MSGKNKIYKTRLRNQIEKKENDNKCIICLGTCLYTENKVTPCCSGVYHQQCLLEWMKISKGRCPVCKMDLEKSNILDPDYTDTTGSFI